MNIEKRKKMWVLLSVLVTLLSIVGLTYAWMAQRASMTTLLKIQPPDTITIVPTATDGSELTELVLDYDKNTDEQDDDGTIHIYRPVCIKSTEPIHRLEIVHTTNLNKMTFNIYVAQKQEINNDITISWLKTSKLTGNYYNQDQYTKLAKQEKLENYQAEADVADAHAYPLYWIAVNCVTEGAVAESDIQEDWQKVTSYKEPGIDPKTNQPIDYYCTYYILEISWKETTKEADLFYIMAQNVAE